MLPARTRACSGLRAGRGALKASSGLCAVPLGAALLGECPQLMHNVALRDGCTLRLGHVVSAPVVKAGASSVLLADLVLPFLALRPLRALFGSSPQGEDLESPDADGIADGEEADSMSGQILARSSRRRHLPIDKESVGYASYL